MKSLIEQAAAQATKPPAASPSKVSPAKFKAVEQENEKLLARVERMVGQSGKMGDRLKATGSELVRTTLTTSTVGGTALLRGYRGGQLAVAGVDVPLALGLTGKLGALGAQVMGYRGSTYMHALADGLFYEGAAHLGHTLGERLRVTRAQKAAAAPGVPPTPEAIKVNGVRGMQRPRPIPQHHEAPHPVPGRHRGQQPEVVMTPVSPGGGAPNGLRLRRPV